MHWYSLRHDACKNGTPLVMSSSASLPSRTAIMRMKGISAHCGNSNIGEHRIDFGQQMRNEGTREDALERAARAIRSAEAILIGAGAGMGVDSGLPDFRGSSGFWKAYPPYAKLGLDFVSLANPRWFAEDPELAWGFYGHRLMLYRETQPHDGFAILHRWMSRMRRGGFVYTSNVDGHFQKAGFSPDQVYEVHGSIGAMQCLAECGEEIFSAHTHSLTIDHQTMRGTALAQMPALRRPGEAQYPDVRRLGLGFIPCGNPAAANEVVAGHRSRERRSSSSSAVPGPRSPPCGSRARTSPVTTRP